MGHRPETSIDGSLYELVARGEKDKYFFQDESTSIQPFDYRYQAYPAVLPEVRQSVPITDIKFGNIVEFDFDFAGDLLVEANLLIDLPSWLPPDIAELNNKSLIADDSGVTYGYTNGIAYFLCKKIEILQDNILIQEISGDALYALSRTRGSYNGLALEDSLAGIHDGSALGVQRAANPGRLVLRLPFPGTYIGDTGHFPIAAVKKQNFRLRVTLRKLEELVEASDSRIDPFPWSRTLYIVKGRGQDKIAFKTIDLIKMQKPSMLLETRQLYTTNRIRELIQEEEHIICFRRYFENVFSFNDFDYSPLDRAATAISVRALSGQFLAERVTSFFRSRIRFRSNQLYKFQQDISGNPYYDSMKLVIAGKEREGNWDAFVYADMIQHAKEERATDIGIITMNWSKGSRKGDGFPADRQPDGGINFTTAVRPQLNISLANITYDPVLGQRISEMRSIVESWAIYQIKGGRGRFKYSN